MENPKVIGRTEDQDADIRADTALAQTVVTPFHGGANGELSVSLFRSVDNEDRGGVVLRITLCDQEQCFLPTSRVIEGGVELHMAGDIEASTLMQSLRELLATTD